MDAEQLERTRSAGRALVRQHLRFEPELPALLDAAEACLGSDRLDRCLELIRVMPLSQRYQGLSALASLVAGTRVLGHEWWIQPHQEPVAARGTRKELTAPDQLLDNAALAEQRDWPATVVELGSWIADDVAVAAWGPLVDDIDLNDPRDIDRIRIDPSDAQVGQRLTARFDVGGVVEAIVERRDGGELGTRLSDETRYSAPAEVDWAWAVAVPPPGPFPLPGDAPDVYDSVVDPLRTRALELGWAPADVGSSWRTRGDVCSALARLGWPWLDGTARSHEWERAVTALVDSLPGRTRST